MRITYTLTPDDFSALQWHFRRSTGLYARAIRRLLIGLGPLVILSAFAMVRDVRYLRWDGLASVVIAFLIMGIFAERIYRLPLLNRLREKRLAQMTALLLARGHNRAFLAEQTLEMNRDGISVRSDLITTSVAWRAVERVEETEAHVFIFTGPNNVIVVPKRAFADAAGAHDFFEDAREYLLAVEEHS